MVGRWCVEAEPGSPERNMATDAGLLAALAEGHECLPTVRVYEWDRPAVSYGRLQSEDAVRTYYSGLPLVRRPTGGRAVRHGADLTVSVACLVSHLPAGSEKTILDSYRCLAAPLAAALTKSGRDIGFGRQSVRGQGTSVDCFDSSVGCDLIDLATGRKLVGSAQRREGPALLQQMSLPLSLLPERESFIGCLQQEYASALQIHDWQTADT